MTTTELPPRGVAAPAVTLPPVPAATSVAVCIPAHDEEGTIAAVVATASAAVGRCNVIVVDDGSTDRTAARAEAAGARVVRIAATGKGGAMQRAVEATTTDIVVFIDADVISLEPADIVALAEPLVSDPRLVLIKPAYTRALHGHPGEGGRVTELMARPLLQLFWPDLAHLSQPLAGECAIRRSALHNVVLADGYAVELALLVDVYVRFGADAIGEVDLGERVHRNRPLRALTAQALEVLVAALVRADGCAPRPR